jgi:hypothetical protein
MKTEPINDMMRIITSQWISAPLYVAVRLGIPDILGKGPTSINDLSRKSGVPEGFLYRILRALAGAGIFQEQNNRCFCNTPQSESLREDKLKPIALMFLSEWHNNAWNKLFEGVLTGKCPFELAHGTDAFHWLEKNPGPAFIVNQANAMKARSSFSQIIQTYDFSGIRTITDIGGGTGGLLIDILKAYPDINGAIIEQPHVIPQTETMIEKAGVQKRCKAIAIDFFTEIPAGSDLYLLANILHDWDDEQCMRILSNCERAVDEHTILLIIEMMIQDGNASSLAKLMDIEMLVMGGGKERTKEEFECLLKKSGFSLTSSISLGDYRMLECMKEGK